MTSRELKHIEVSVDKPSRSQVEAKDKPSRSQGQAKDKLLMLASGRKKRNKKGIVPHPPPYYQGLPLLGVHDECCCFFFVEALFVG